MRVLVTNKLFFELDIPDTIDNTIDDIQDYIDDHLEDLWPRPDIESEYEFVEVIPTITDD